MATRMSSVARFSLLPHDQTFFDLFVEAGKNSVHSAQLLDKLMRECPDSGTLQEPRRLDGEQRGSRGGAGAVRQVEVEMDRLVRGDVDRRPLAVGELAIDE